MVEVSDGEVLLVGRFWVVAVRNVDNVLLNVFLDHKPRTATKSHAFALSNGVEPVALVMADELACLQLDDVARQFAQIATEVVVIIDFT